VPNFPIVDTHLHLWDTSLFHYPWLDAIPSLNLPHLPCDYARECGSVAVEAMVFVQCETEICAFRDEAKWVAEQAKHEPRIKGMVAWAPLENGRAVDVDLAGLAHYEILRGIRRIIQSEDDIDFCLQPSFIEGVRTLASFGLTFDICIDHRHMKNIIKFASMLPEVSMVLDHIGKPPIKEGLIMPWANQLRELARLPHVFCKISGVATEADHGRWSADDLKRYIEVAIDAFGFDRIMFGTDWPVATQAIAVGRWVRLLDEVMADANEIEQRKFWRDNATRFYRLGI
jgi:L-fuconolactonase